MGKGNQTKHPAWTSLNSQQGNAETERPSELNGLKTLCGYFHPYKLKMQKPGWRVERSAEETVTAKDGRCLFSPSRKSPAGSSVCQTASHTNHEKPGT